jgi:hypothetical protein
MLNNDKYMSLYWYRWTGQSGQVKLGYTTYESGKSTTCHLSSSTSAVYNRSELLWTGHPLHPSIAGQSRLPGFNCQIKSGITQTIYSSCDTHIFAFGQIQMAESIY